ncbi:MAG: hypothetical protein R3B70_15265 [Polyangiaceae bacterium]
MLRRPHLQRRPLRNPPSTPGNCLLDPGGTLCSQCIVGNRCNQTEQCLNNPTCASNMACFQRCAINGTPSQCQTQCCGNNGTCTAWTQCVV